MKYKDRSSHSVSLRDYLVAYIRYRRSVSKMEAYGILNVQWASTKRTEITRIWELFLNMSHITWGIAERDFSTTLISWHTHQGVNIVKTHGQYYEEAFYGFMKQ